MLGILNNGTALQRHDYDDLNVYPVSILFFCKKALEKCNNQRIFEDKF